jgi:hypothetical protein
VRLCGRGHANPYDAIFCGDCGSTELTEMTGSIPFWIRAIAWMGIGFGLIGFVTLLLRSPAATELFSAIICLAVIVVVIAAVLPKATTNALLDVLLLCLKAVGQLIKFFLFGINKSRGK